MNIVIDPAVSGDDLRQQLFAGNLVILDRLQALNDFVDYTRDELTQLFKPYDPEHVHEHIDPTGDRQDPGSLEASLHTLRKVEEARAGRYRRGRLPAEDTHYDLPKPRTSFPVRHLTTGVTFAFPVSARIVWYSARPSRSTGGFLFPVRNDNAMSFDLASFDRAVPNTSNGFDYYQNNASRLTTATQVGRQHQARPAAADHQPDQELVVLPAPGEVLLFSGAQLHASTPNASGRAQVSSRLPDGLRARPARAGRGALPGGRALHRHRDPRLHQRRRRGGPASTSRPW